MQDIQLIMKNIYIYPSPFLQNHLDLVSEIITHDNETSSKLYALRTPKGARQYEEQIIKLKEVITLQNWELKSIDEYQDLPS